MMRSALIVFFFTIVNFVIGQINLHSNQCLYSFNPALTGIDSSSRSSLSYTHIECYGEYLYADIAASMHIKQTRYGITGCFKMYDYFAGVTYLKPVSSMVSLNSTYKIKIRNTDYIFKPAVEVGLSTLYMIGELIQDNQSTFIINARDSRFRYSASFAFFNKKINFGVNYQGINRPKYIESKPYSWLPQNREIGISFSNLLGYFAFKKEYRNKAIAIYLTSADRFPIVADESDHYWSIHRVGFSCSKPKIIYSASFGLLNNNARFREYKADIIYHLWRFDLGLKIAYCDEPHISSPYIIHSGVQDFPMTNASIINYSLTYHFSNKRASFTNWANILLF